ncbi:MAG: 3-phosphoglycerate dehydrogenase [Bacteroidales bacterium]|jgi:D-3-phosphoglycerate dehydrogenase|nr:3-phosphoglycerate dehydrogenase [Bacteroidales bacterium]
MTKVLIATEKPFAANAVSAIRNVVENAGFELVLLEKYTDKKQFIDAVANVDALIVRSDIVDAEVISNAKNLKIVVRAGAGFDNLDLNACTEKGIVAMNTPGQNSNAVAELAIGMMIYMIRNRFDGTSGTELKEKTLGIHAYGNVGKNLARIAKGLGMKIMAFDPFIDKSVIENDGVVAASSVEELFKNNQYISLHIPATDKTKKSINKALVSLMPKNGVLINTARKEVINEEELISIFEERTDLRYVSDIQPDSASTFIEKFGNRVFFTPKKAGAQTAEANNNAGVAAAEQIVKFIKNGDRTFQLNK